MRRKTPKQDSLKPHAKEIKRRYRTGESVRMLVQFFGVSRKTVTEFLQRCGVRLRSKATAQEVAGKRRRGKYKGKNSPNYGDKNPRWRGFRIVNSRGYALLWMPEHPRANSEGRVFEHIVVAEKMLGRSLQVDERVHHRNRKGKRDDNRPSNLEVMSNREHLILHRTITGLDDVPGLYTEGMSMLEITEDKGIDKATVKRVLLEHDVPLRSRSEAVRNSFRRGRHLKKEN